MDINELKKLINEEVQKNRKKESLEEINPLKTANQRLRKLFGKKPTPDPNVTQTGTTIIKPGMMPGGEEEKTAQDRLGTIGSRKPQTAPPQQQDPEAVLKQREKFYDPDTGQYVDAPSDTDEMDLRPMADVAASLERGFVESVPAVRKMLENPKFLPALFHVASRDEKVFKYIEDFINKQKALHRPEQSGTDSFAKASGINIKPKR